MKAAAEWIMPEVELPCIPDYSVDITHYGAVGDGRTDNTSAIHRAIQQCSEAGGGRVVIPPGIWLTGPLTLASRLELHVERGALVLFSRQFEDYPLIHSYYEGTPFIRCQSPLNGEHLEDVAITGEGIFDGNGDAWRPVKIWKMTEPQWERLIQSGGVVEPYGETWWPTAAAMQGAQLVKELQEAGNQQIEDYVAARDYLRPNLLSLRHCKRVLLKGPTFQNSAAWCLHPFACEHVTLQQLTIRNPWYAQNGDGMDIESCKYVEIADCMLDVGDDAICIKSGKDEAGRRLGLPCEYVTIHDCVVYHGHGGFVIGSEMSGGVRYVHVQDCMFIGTEIGLRFKSARGRGGVVEDIRIERIQMSQIEGAAISFNLFYEGKAGSGQAELDPQPVSVETPVFRRIQMNGITCAGAQIAVLVNGLPEMPLQDVSISGLRAQTEQGISCYSASRLCLEDAELLVQEEPVVKLHQCEEVRLIDVTCCGIQAENRMMEITGERSRDIKWLTK